MMPWRGGRSRNPLLRLALQDLDWSSGCVLIRAGKTSQERVLPMAADVGAALARYLQEVRPVSSNRAVFLSHIPPYKPLRSSSIMANLVNRLLRQAGITAPCSGAYVLRHTL